MNENLDLTKILRNVPKGTVLYSSIYGNVRFNCIKDGLNYPIIINALGETTSTTKDGRHRHDFNGECTLFPSKDQRDWSKFKVEPKFEPFQKVLVRNGGYCWHADFYSNKSDGVHRTAGGSFTQCIPYEGNEHLLGTMDNPDRR